MENARFEFSVKLNNCPSVIYPLPIYDAENSLIGAFTGYHDNLFKGFIAAQGWPDSLFAEDGLWFTLKEELGKPSNAIVTSHSIGTKSVRIKNIERG